MPVEFDGQGQVEPQEEERPVDPPSPPSRSWALPAWLLALVLPGVFVAGAIFGALARPSLVALIHTPTATVTDTPTATATDTPMPTATSTPAPTVTPTSTPTPAPTAIPTSRPTPAPTAIPASTPTPAPTPTSTLVADAKFSIGANELSCSFSEAEIVIDVRLGGLPNAIPEYYIKAVNSNNPEEPYLSPPSQSWFWATPGRQAPGGGQWQHMSNVEFKPPGTYDGSLSEIFVVDEEGRQVSDVFRVRLDPVCRPLVFIEFVQ